jgi:hypothetical protein
MSLIKPRTRGKHVVHHRTRLDRENNETLHAYAAFIGEDAEYVLNQVIDTVLGKDKEFVQWRAQHPDSFAPQPKRRIRRSRRAHAGSLVVGTSGAADSMARTTAIDASRGTAST